MENDAEEQAKFYEWTETFLLSHSHLPAAGLGYKCLELNKKLGLCDPKQPWVVNEEGLQHMSLACLPLDAATKAHFALLAIDNHYMMHKQAKFFVKPFKLKELEQILQSISDFLQKLILQSSVVLNNEDDKWAEEFLKALSSLFEVGIKANDAMFGYCRSSPSIKIL
ncbi:hypothetical protein C8R42DRAFT_649167 [Lentinula raphanica]|nr:hypothetical protein C8R42DRAFT_649167 [Lentinula raphanica]